MYILGIDTSFDDTAAAVVYKETILSSVLSTELSVHQKYGGVVPSLARNAHAHNIDLVIARALKRAHIDWDVIDAIAVTRGPGLAIALEIGIAKAVELARLQKKPLVAVNHMEGHLLSFLARPLPKRSSLKRNYPDLSAIFPTLSILVSGGHTQFVYAERIGSYRIVGETKDDAMGEAFDKVGRLLGLGYPAGRLVEMMARKGKYTSVRFPIPMQQVKTAETSFSGLKTAALRVVEGIRADHGELTADDISAVAHGFQAASIQHLQEKIDYCLAELHKEGVSVSSLTAGGGVIANTEVRISLKKIAKKEGIPLYLPYSKKLCTDNAAMIALAGYYQAAVGNYVECQETIDRLPTMRLSSDLVA